MAYINGDTCSHEDMELNHRNSSLQESSWFCNKCGRVYVVPDPVGENVDQVIAFITIHEIHGISTFWYGGLHPNVLYTSRGSD